MVSKQSSTIALIEWVLVFAALTLFSITETYQSYVTIGLGLLAVFYFERGLRGKLISVKTGLETPIILFIASAGLAVWNSYNQEIALLQFGRILAAVAFFFAMTDNQAPFPEIIAVAFLCAAAVLAIYWPSKTDFSQLPTKFQWINSLGQWWYTRIPTPPGPEINSNVAAGALLVSVPFGVALTYQNIKNKKRIATLLLTSLTLIVLVGLLLTASRGAWIGLAGIIVFAFLALIQKRYYQIENWKRIYWFGIFIACLLAFIFIIASNNLDKLVGQIPDVTGSMHSRVETWRNSLGLIKDYIFTGSGLQTFWMVNSMYAMLMHVRYLAHAHNSFLQIWIEQGVLGALSVIWVGVVVAKWVWDALDNKNVPLLGWAGVAALIGASIHGMVDVVFYIERTLPIIGMALGYASLIWSQSHPQVESVSIRRNKTVVTLVILAGLGITGIIFYRSIASYIYSNLGALSQTQIELSQYDPDNFGNLTMDQIRTMTDLSTTERYFEKSLFFQPNNLTALQRLTEIDMSRGETQKALGYMERAWEAGARDQVTRLLYGDTLIASGMTEEGARIIKGLTWAEERLIFQAWYRYWANQQVETTKFLWEAVLDINPDNKDVARNLDNLKKLLNP